MKSRQNGKRLPYERMMDENAKFEELVKDAPNFVSMERGELVLCAYAMYAAGTKANAENATPGTCYDTGKSRIFHCSECGLGMDDVYVDDETLYPPADFPRFCPNCGRKVISK